jgi:hypothetical protein
VAVGKDRADPAVLRQRFVYCGVRRRAVALDVDQQLEFAAVLVHLAVVLADALAERLQVQALKGAAGLCIF